MAAATGFKSSPSNPTTLPNAELKKKKEVSRYLCSKDREKETKKKKERERERKGERER